MSAIRSVLVVVLILFCACSSLSKDDEAFLKAIPSAERSDIVTLKAQNLYEKELIGKENYGVYEAILTNLDLALKLDSNNENAKGLKKKTEIRVTKLYDDTLAKYKALKDKNFSKESDQVKAISIVATLEKVFPNRAETIQAVKEVKAIREVFLKKKHEVLLTQEKNLLNTKNPSASSPIILQLSNTIDDIQDLDPNDSEAKRLEAKVAKIVEDSLTQDFQKARSQVSKEDFNACITSIDKIAKSAHLLKPEAKAELTNLSYLAYFGLAKSLFSQNKNQDADNKINKALSFKKTNEAAALKQKITQALSVKDYDADIDQVLASIDDRIKAGDLSAAKDQIDSLLDNVKQTSSKTKLSNRLSTIQSHIETLYKKAVSLYDDEDYKGAFSMFETIVKTNSSYERAQAYYEKTRAKLRALGGD